MPVQFREVVTSTPRPSDGFGCGGAVLSAEVNEPWTEADASFVVPPPVGAPVLEPDGTASSVEVNEFGTEAGASVAAPSPAGAPISGLSSQEALIETRSAAAGPDGVQV